MSILGNRVWGVVVNVQFREFIDDRSEFLLDIADAELV